MRKLILVRGLPGSGKTTYAQRQFPDAIHHAADDFFEELGRFDGALIKKAHGQCQDRTRASLQAGRTVVVHNTFTQFWEMKTYFEMAQRMGIPLQVIHVESGLSNEQVVSRNVHNVPLEAITRMRERWQPHPGEEVVRAKSSYHRDRR